MNAGMATDKADLFQSHLNLRLTGQQELTVGSSEDENGRERKNDDQNCSKSNNTRNCERKEHRLSSKEDSDGLDGHSDYDASASASPVQLFGFQNDQARIGNPNPKKVHEVSRILNNILYDYDHRIRPDFYGPAVQINVTMLVRGIASISEVDMEFKVDFYLRQYWEDPRLEFEIKPRVDAITLSHEFTHKVWQPDTFFPNEKKSYIHSATVLNEFIRLNYTGHILKSTRLTLTASCPMSLKLFPMDHQICSVDLESYGFTNGHIQYNWRDGKDSVKMDFNSVTLPQFQVLGHRQKKGFDITSTGNYSTLTVDFLLVRSLNYYLTQIYIPAALIVIISWFALYMGRDAAAERMALGVTTVLTITTLLLSTNSNSPKISYVKALDIYLETCFTCVFVTLLESATIGYLIKKLKEKQQNLENLEKIHKLAVKEKFLAQQRRSVLMKQSLMTKSVQNLSECKNDTQNQSQNQLVVPSISLELIDIHRSADFKFDFEKDGDSLRRSKEMLRDCDASTVQLQIDDDDGIANNIADEGTIAKQSFIGTNATEGLDSLAKCRARVSRIDVVSRILFPIGFTLFNLAYWMYYLNVGKLPDHGDWTIRV